MEQQLYTTSNLEKTIGWPKYKPFRDAPAMLTFIKNASVKGP